MAMQIFIRLLLVIFSLVFSSLSWALTQEQII